MTNAEGKSKLHLVPPVQSSAGADRGICGKQSRQLVGHWKGRAILFIGKPAWDALCQSCKLRAAAWMKANDASPFPVHPVSFADVKAAYEKALDAGEESSFGPFAKFVREAV